MAEQQGRVVVGFDGSDESTGALEAALALAGPLGAEVDVVTSWKWPIAWSSVPVGSTWSPLDDAEEIQAHADEVIGAAPTDDVPVSGRTVEGGAAQVLVDAAEGADLLVVGSRGRGGFRGLLLGSVSTACMQQATSPVLVHRRRGGTGRASEVIVVGVDGSRESGEALRFAVTLARRLGHTVRVITAWEWPRALNRNEAPFDHWTPEDDARATASSAIDSAEDLLDDTVRITAEMAEGSAARVLIDASEDAAYLVLGNRGIGGLRGLLVGSVSQECAQYAACSVIVHRS